VGPSGSTANRPRWVSHATPLGGRYVAVRDPSPAHAGNRGKQEPERLYYHSTAETLRRLMTEEDGGAVADTSTVVAG